MALEDDPWVKANSDIGAARLHALGNVAINWNSCEHQVHALFTIMLGVDEPIARIIDHEMGPKTLWIKVIELAEHKALPADYVDALKQAVVLSDAVRANRNLLIHADIIANNQATSVESVLKLIRRRGSSVRYNGIQHELADIRRVSDEIKTLTQHLQKLCTCLLLRKLKPQPLPDRPPLPRSMVLPDPLQANAKQKPPRLPSRK